VEDSNGAYRLVVDAASTRGSDVTEKPKHPKPQRKVFNLSWETEVEPEDDGQQNHEEESDEDDFQGHASGFNRPKQF
jgi:hypothetical protein